MSDEIRNELIKSQAGMRFIALMTFYNSGNFERIKGYIEDNYADIALMADPVRRRLLDMKTGYKLNGRLRVKKAVGISENHVILHLEAEKNDNVFQVELRVHEDYPHLVLYHVLKPLEEG